MRAVHGMVAAPARNLGGSWQTQCGRPWAGVIYHGAASGSVCHGGQAQMGEAELVLVGTGGIIAILTRRTLTRTNAQLEADRSAGRLCKLGMPQESS